MTSGIAIVAGVEANGGRRARLGSVFPQLVLVTGKGGVGKTMLSAVLARSFAARGRRVLVLEVDPRESLHSAFDASPSGGEVVRVDRQLSFQNLQPKAVLDDLVRERLKVGLLVRRTLQSPIYKHFTEGAPGLKELAVLGHALRTLQRGAAEVVVLDAPATGHGLALLGAPQLVSEVIPRGPVGELAGELARFIADPAACRVVIVTRPEEMPVQEALELAEELRRRRHDPALLVVNGLLPESTAREPRDAVTELWRARRALHERELSRLRDLWHGSRVVLPQLALSLGLPLIAELGAEFERGFEALAEPPWP